jgi:hypothetical protein
MRAARGMNMVIPGIPAGLHGIDPAVEAECQFARHTVRDREPPCVCYVFRAAGIGDRVRAWRQLNGFAIATIYLWLKIEVRREPLDWIGIDTTQAIAKDK